MSKTKITLFATLGVAVIAFIILGFSRQGGNDPWTAKQLMPPAELAEAITAGNGGNYHVFDLGPSGEIQGAVHIGEGRNPANIDKLRAELDQLPKDAQVVIYCGCCPFKNCPNIRPAFELLNGKGFTNHRLLNLSENLKTDWIDHGYPMAD